ncbi:hypothetical protein SNE25_07845 [Mucilaginibacter sabulilitoris]|uniref:Uncharacterized protein n=1 Tax=Mucilaginibacter sabulilitoris TaxID=1173583 RepID=A0ABZ0TTM7_9SPHI|nr:hypothetical protein [Mucilaginibacter sabulilitoris]WPU95433.1 hypothetical protein SNE25_07845 [Mucilaginibacter sabulilitoris]
MKKCILFLLIIACSACSKKSHQAAPCNPGMCTMMFTTIGIHFVDKTGKDAVIKDFKAVNLRTNKNIKTEPIGGPGSNASFHVIATDGNMKEFTNEGDDVKITATDSVTNQTKSVIVKLAGGCACHISKLSGPDTLAFD